MESSRQAVAVSLELKSSNNNTLLAQPKTSGKYCMHAKGPQCYCSSDVNNILLYNLHNINSSNYTNFPKKEGQANTNLLGAVKVKAGEGISKKAAAVSWQLK